MVLTVGSGPLGLRELVEEKMSGCRRGVRATPCGTWVSEGVVCGRGPGCDAPPLRVPKSRRVHDAPLCRRPISWMPTATKPEDQEKLLTDC